MYRVKIMVADKFAVEAFFDKHRLNLMFSGCINGLCCSMLFYSGW